MINKDKIYVQFFEKHSPHVRSGFQVQQSFGHIRNKTCWRTVVLGLWKFLSFQYSTNQILICVCTNRMTGIFEATREVSR